MKNLLKLVVVCAALGATLSFTACGNKGGAADPGGIPAGPQPGVGPTGSNVDPRSCELGQVAVQGYGCLNRQSCENAHGWIPGENRCVPGTLVTEEIKFGASYGARFFGSLQVLNDNQFQLLMKYAGKCEPYWVGVNFGTYECGYWTKRGGFIELRTFGSGTAASWNMTIGAGTSNPHTFQPWYANTGYISLSQVARMVDWNESQGMQIIGANFNGADVGLRLQTSQGRPSSTSFSADLVFQNVVFARVTLQRY